MAPRSLRVRLTDIRGEIVGIRNLTKDESLESFGASWAMKRAVEHALLIIAEAAKHVPQDLKDTRPEVPWPKIHGLGNILRHEYRMIDPDILWSIVREHLDTLDAAAAALLAGLPEDG
jgi:uncharacterized protein with HEPN domain